MNNTSKKILSIMLLLGVVFLGLNIWVKQYLKNKIETFIHNELPENMIYSYSGLKLHTFSGSLTIDNPSLIIKNTADSLQHTFIDVEKLEISGASYWDFLVKDEIYIRSIVLLNPKIAYFKDRVNKQKDSVPKSAPKSHTPIYVDKIQFQNASLHLYEKGKDSTKLSVKDMSLEIERVAINDNTKGDIIPFAYKDYNIKGDSLFLKVNAYDNLTVGDFNLKNSNVSVNNLSLKTKYSKKELSKIISKERDHFNLTLPSLLIDDLDIGFENDTLFVKSKKISLISPSAEIYRDKLVADDMSVKPLYSKMLRDLPFPLTVDSLAIVNGNILYEERVKEENMGGTISFKDLNISIANVSNTYKAPTKTELNIKVRFMESTPFSAKWTFDVNNQNDYFLFTADVGKMNAEKMNHFTEPNLNVKLEGQVEKTFFTIDGNHTASTTDLKIHYSNFKVNVLRKESEKKNKLISAVVNILIPKNSEKHEQYYRESTAQVSRDKTKSVFNFLWISLESALKKAM